MGTLTYVLHVKKNLYSDNAFNSLQANVSFLYPLKASKNQRYKNFQGYRNETFT